MQSYAVNMLKMTEKSRKFVQGMNDVITSGMKGHKMGAYAGYVDPALPNAQLEYWNSNYPRLQQIKKAIDPQVGGKPLPVPMKSLVHCLILSRTFSIIHRVCGCHEPHLLSCGV